MQRADKKKINKEKTNIQERSDPSADFEGQGKVNHQREQLHLAYGEDELQECHIFSAPFHLQS